MIKKNRFALALLGMMVVPVAQAEAQDYKPYFGIGLGVVGLEESTPTFNQKNYVFGGYVRGGVDFNDYLGAEVRIGTAQKGSTGYPAGTIDPNAATVDLQGEYFVSYLAKLQFPIMQDFRLYALGGGTTAKLKTTVTTTAGSTASKAVKIGASYGAGLEYSFGENSSVGAEWMQYWTNVTVAPNSKAKLWSGVLSWSLHY